MKSISKIPMRLIFLLVLGASIAAASTLEAQTAGCARIDHANVDPLRFADKKGAPETINGAKPAGSLLNLQVVDCDKDFFYVKYEGRTRAIDRLDVTAGKMVPPKCNVSAADQQRLAANGAVDGQICTQ